MPELGNEQAMLARRGHASRIGRLSGRIRDAIELWGLWDYELSFPTSMLAVDRKPILVLMLLLGRDRHEFSVEVRCTVQSFFSSIPVAVPKTQEEAKASSGNTCTCGKSGVRLRSCPRCSLVGCDSCMFPHTTSEPSNLCINCR